MDSNKYMALLVAIRQADLIRVRKIIKSNSLILDEKWTDYMLLITALQKNRIKIANLLLDKGCRVRRLAKTNFFFTPLYYAVRLNNIKLVKKLLKNGASINDKDRNEETPLCYAMENKRYEIVDLILSMYDFENMSPTCYEDIAHFHVACRRNKEKIIRKFIDHGMSINSCVDLDSDKWAGFTPLHFAVNNLSVNVVKFLLEYGANFSAQDVEGMTPLHLAYFKELKDTRYINGRTYSYYTTKLELLKSKLYKLKKESIIDRILLAHEIKCLNPVDNRGISHFHIACARDFDIVKLFLDYGVNVNESIPLHSNRFSGYTPLHIAVNNYRLQIIKLLLKNGAFVNAKTKEGLTPLHLAVNRNKIKIIKTLLDNNADVNIKDNEGATPLHYAFNAPYHNNDIIDLFLQYSSKSNIACDKHGFSHFHIACTRNNVNLIESFLKNGVSINSSIDFNNKHWSGFTALHFAIKYNRKSIVELLLQHGADANSKSTEIKALHLACKQYHQKFLDLINKYERELAKTKSYKSINWNSNRKSQIAIIELLLKYNADINIKNVDGKTPLMLAYDCNFDDLEAEVHGCLNPKECHFEFLEDVREELYERRKEIIHVLLSHNADVNICASKNTTILHIVCNTLDIEAPEMAKLFLKKGANVNAANNAGLTPLYLAVENRNTELVEILLNYGADVNFINVNNLQTPLHIATKNYEYGECDTSIIKMLIAKGADPNAKQNNGMTPLHNLALLKSFNLHASLDCLLEAKADVNMQDQKGRTPLHLACYNHNDVAVHEFIEYGANINIEDCDGKTALSFTYDSLLFNTEFHEIDKYKEFEYVQNHIKKLIEAGLHVNKKLRIYSYLTEQNDFHHKCRTELNRMKNTIVDNYTSLYLILLKDQQDMTKHIKNNKFIEILKSKNFDKDFPEYGFFLKLQYKQGLTRSALLKPAIESMEFLIRLRLPDLCSEQIFKYLSNENLKNLIKAKEINLSYKRNLEKTLVEDSQPLPKIQRIQ